VSTVVRFGVLALAAIALACTLAQSSSSGSIQPLSSELSTAFDAPVAAELIDSGRILTVSVDLPPTPEIALRVAQGARARYDSVAKLDEIEIQFQYNEQAGQVLKTITRRGGTYLPALLPVDTTPGWMQRILAPPPAPLLKVSAVRPTTDTVFTQGGLSSVVAVTDTTVGNRSFWRIATKYRSPNGVTLVEDVVTLDKTTLQPIDEQRTDASTKVTMHYDGKHVDVEITNHHSGRLSRDTTFAFAPYSASELELLLATLPLAKGYTTRLPLLRAGSSASGLDWISVLVSGVDTSRDAWVVEVAGVHTPFERRWVGQTATRLDRPSDIKGSK
jgi:hypothetical protein